MGVIADAMVALAGQKWASFGNSTRSLDEQWSIVGNESVQPYQAYVTPFWAAVGYPERDGAYPEPWSGAFISWCFVEAGAAADAFRPHRKHSRYIDWIRLQDGTSPLLRLRPPTSPIALGDLIWNARTAGGPVNHEEAIAHLDGGNFFASHVDIVVAVRDGECDSIGGNVHYADVGGSVVRSTWRLHGNGALVDDNGVRADTRKRWIGVIKNGL